MILRTSGLRLLLAAVALACATPEGSPGPPAPPGRAKEVCWRNADCAPYRQCTGEKRCRCQLDEDCADTQRCLAGICRFK